MSKIYSSLHPNLAKRRLCISLIIFFMALTLPVCFLLDRVYTQLENEAYFSARDQAEQLVERIEQRLQNAIAVEQKRPFAEYSFFNILENPLLQATSVKFSPLSEIPPNSNVPGLSGFFQIYPDGSLHIPALPELNSDSQTGLSQNELKTRIALKEKIRSIIKLGAVKKDKNKMLSKLDEKREQIQPQTDRFDDIFHAEEMESKASVERAQTADQQNAGLFKSSPVKKTKALSRRQLQALNINEPSRPQQDLAAQKLQQRQKKNRTQYRSRTEKGKLPDQSVASSLFKRSNRPPYSAVSETYHSATSSDSLAAIPEPAISEQDEPLTIDIFSFESEVGPLQLIRLSGPYWCFFRHVWHNNNRYLQGFIVDRHIFIDALVQPALNSTSLGSLVIAYNGQIIEHLNRTTEQQEIILYRSTLSLPFQDMELIVNASILATGPGALVIDMLAVTLGIILIVGLLGFYRIGTRQIELARQQQNFISAVSHELKTPLTSIRMYGEMLRNGWVADDSKKQTYYDYIFFESERLSRLIANVLQLAKLDNHSERLNLSGISPELLLQRMHNKIAAQMEASHFKLNLVPNTQNLGDLMVNIDEDAFVQIFINLVDNALKFSANAEHKILDVGLKIQDRRNQALFYIRDYGPGINKNQLKKIFQLFYRSGDELTRTKPGTGIGLALVAQLAESMQAKIDVINRHPGVEFQVKLNLK